MVDSKNKENKPKEKIQTNNKRKKEVLFSPESIFMKFNVGLEKVVAENSRNDCFNYSKKLDWVKEDVSYVIHKVVNHPTLDDGYICEIQNRGDGYSYIPELLEAFKDLSTHHVWVKLKHGDYAYFERKGSSGLFTYNTDLKPEDGDIVIFKSGKMLSTNALYIENYVVFYISLILLIVAVISYPVSYLFKNVWYNKEKTILSQDFYVGKVLLPIDTLKNQTQKESERLLSLRYSDNKGWHYIKERSVDGVIHHYFQPILQNGDLGKEQLLANQDKKDKTE